MNKKQLHSYIICYDCHCDEVEARSSYHAWCIAMDVFKPPRNRKYLISVHLNKEVVTDF